jgi:alanine racemase
VTKLIPEGTGRAWLDVDLAALIRNARRYADVAGAPLLPMVKANAYGLGAIPVTRALETLDPWGYGVATPEEGAQLRQGGIDRAVLVFSPLQVDPPQLETIQRHRLTPVIGDLAALDVWLERSGGPFHLEVDTGMSRSGFSWRDATAIAALRNRLQTTKSWEGVFTHFHSPDTDPGSVPVQLDRFCAVLGALPRGVALVHTANSAAGGIPLVRGGDLARPGIFLYGGEAGIEHPEPVARLSARVIALRKLEPGDSVSYAASWHAQHPTTIATLSIGYADGVLRSLGNRGVVELNGELVPIAGRVTMDMLMVDVGTRPVRLGDTATLFGGQVTLDEQARRAGTNSYELLTAVSARVERRYR